ncbi:MAG: hypothetical protein MJ216_00465 [Bacilli bacterium]|mgnify:CR=1 FL=1|nr:hypothetical protein [Bacilli bacterium]
MAETRFEKYKKYRESSNEIKKEVATKSRDYNLVSEKHNTTSTLPLDEVLGQIDEEDETISNQLITKKRLQIGITIAIGVLLLAGIVIFAIVAWGGK